MINKIAIIRQLPSGKYRLYSKKKGPDGKRRNLGTYDSLAGAKQREKEVQTFKHMSDDGMADDKETKMLSELSNIAEYLEKAGYVDKAKEVYNTMCLIDPTLEQDAHDLPSGNDLQMNTENMGYVGGDGTAGGYSMLNIPEAQFADDEPLPSLQQWMKKYKTPRNEQDFNRIFNSYYDHILAPNRKKWLDDTAKKIMSESIYTNRLDKITQKLHKIDDILANKEIWNKISAKTKQSIIEEQIKLKNELEKIIKFIDIANTDEPLPGQYTSDGEDILAGANGIRGNTQINEGMGHGFSDAYFYSGFGNLEGPYRSQN